MFDKFRKNKNKKVGNSETIIRMFCDNGYVLWKARGPYDWDELDLSSELISELREWSRLTEFEDDPSLSEEHLMQWGSDLAANVERELGEGYTVKFEND